MNNKNQNNSATEQLKIKKTRTAAEQGDANAQWELGLAYEDGDGVEQDYAEAARWYRLAAEQGDVDAQDSLGQLYYDGKGVKQDYAEAARWFQKAADKNDPFGLYHLGILYYYGEGVEENCVKALQLFLKSTEPIIIDGEEHLVYVGNVVNRIAYMYAHGQGTQQDYLEAAKWYRKIVHHDPEAMFQLALLYDEGNGVEQNPDEAIKLYKNAAAEGHVIAQYNLGCLYHDQQNYAEARKSNQQAADQGDEDAQEWLESYNNQNNKTMKEFVRQHRDDINHFVHPVFPVKYKQDGALYRGIEKAIEANPTFTEIIDSIDDNLSREMVTTYYRDDLYKGFIATLLWGGFHKDRNTMRRFVTIATMDKDSIVHKLESVKQLLAKGEIKEAVDSMIDGENEIEGIKMSYISKVLYFLAYDMEISPKPVIFDKFLMRAHCALLDCMGFFFPYFYDGNDNLIYGHLYELSDIYINYLDLMNQTAEEYGVDKVDNLEAWLFGWPLNQAGSSINPRRVVMQKCKENCTLEQIVMLARNCFNEDEEDVAALIRIIKENHVNLDTFVYDKKNLGCSKEYPIMINETENYVHLERTLADTLFYNRKVDKSLILQELLDENGRKIDCLTFKVWPAWEDEPKSANPTNTERYYFDITAGYNALK